jgi:hypothetical protein
MGINRGRGSVSADIDGIGTGSRNDCADTGKLGGCTEDSHRFASKLELLDAVHILREVGAEGPVAQGSSCQELECVDAESSQDTGLAAEIGGVENLKEIGARGRSKQGIIPACSDQGGRRRRIPSVEEVVELVATEGDVAPGACVDKVFDAIAPRDQ